MYDEFERAVTGKARRGLPFLAWVGIFVGLLFVMGVVGVGFAISRVASHVEGFVEEFEVGPALMAAEMLSEMEPELMSVLASDTEVGRVILKNLQSGDWEEWQEWEGWDDIEVTDELDGSLHIRTDEGEVTAELKGGEDGGFLVIRSPEGHVRLDLRKGDEGGELLIRTPEETVRLSAGDAARGMPGWVPRLKGMPDNPRHVFSATSSEGFLGAVTWETDRSPEAVLESYRDRLEGAGFEIGAEHSAHSRKHRGEALWGKNEAQERVVFVAASEKKGVTEVLLGFGGKTD
ncbi:hypothetical protein ACFL3S_11200 [Gemmatimonadota bacterium]